MVLLFPSVGSFAQQGVLFINEVLASNSSSITDQSGSNEDWIELYNAGPVPLDLSGFRLSDDIQAGDQHVLSGPAAELTIPAQGHFIIWASGNTGLGANHLNFKLSASGESLLLFSPAGDLIDLIDFPQQHADVSYGRAGDGMSQWLYFEAPTPGAANAGTGLLGQLDPPTFSVPAGSHTGPLAVAITHPDPEAEIYYSLDGSRPGPELLNGHIYQYKNLYPFQNNPTVGTPINDTLRAFQYSAPLTLIDISPEPDFLSRRNTTSHPYYPTEYMPNGPVRKANVVRARAYKEGYLPSEVVTNTYLITSDGQFPYELPVLSLSTEREHLFSHEDGIYNAGIDYEQWRLADLGAMADGETPANWTRKSEFPLSMEWFDAGGTDRTFQRNAGFRTHGSYSKLFRRKSLRLYFKEQYGDPELDHAIFPLQSDTRFKRIVVHISGNDDGSTNMRDMTLQAMLRHMNFETLDAQPAVVFLDGEFWGVHGMRERYDEKYFDRVLNIAEGDVDVVEKNRHASIGDSLEWSSLLNYVAQQDPLEPAVYEELRTRIDMENHIDHNIAQLYVCNFDWPHTNWKAFRKRTNGYVEGAPHAHDGRWRWLMFDLDWGFNLHGIHPASSLLLDQAVEPGLGDNTILLRKLLRNQEYRHGFINRAADMLNTAFRPEVVSEVIDHHRELLENDMQEHVQRWPDTPTNISEWYSKVDTLDAFGNARQQHFRQQIQDFFELPGQHQLQVDVSDVAAGWVRTNTIDLLPVTHGVEENVYPWTGIYFEEVPVRLEAHAFPGWSFSHWEGDLQGTDSAALLSLIGNASVTAVFEPAPLCSLELLSYWDLDQLPGGNLNEVPADGSLQPGATITYPGNGTGYMDRTPEHEGSALNSLDGSIGRALRVRNPSDGRYLLIGTSAAGHRDISLSFAVRRTSNGADSLRISYTTDPDQVEWFPLAAPFPVFEGYQVKEFSLAGETGTFNNEYLMFRIEFLGPQASGLSGNCRFDNILVKGRPLPAIEATLCNEDTFMHEGVGYGVGDHILVNDQAMDCDQMVLLQVSSVDLDTTVIADGAMLSVAPQEGPEYQWLDCQDMTPIAGADQSSFTPFLPGDYAVQLDLDGCTATSSCHFSPGDPYSGITVHPIPAMDLLYITSNSLANGAAFQLFDVTGRLVREGGLDLAANTIDVKSLTSGTYVLQVRSTSGAKTRYSVKIIVE